MTSRMLMLALFAGLAAPQVAVAQEQDPASKETKICRKAETRTGTRIKAGRKCKTSEEWQKDDEERARIPVSLTVTEGQADGTPRPRPQ